MEKSCLRRRSGHDLLRRHLGMGYWNVDEAQRDRAEPARWVCPGDSIARGFALSGWRSDDYDQVDCEATISVIAARLQCLLVPSTPPNFVKCVTAPAPSSE